MITHHLQTFQFSRSVSDFDCVGILEIFFLIYIFFFKFKNLNFFFEFFFFFIILKRFFFPLKKFCVCVCVLPCDVIGQWRKKKFQKNSKTFVRKNDIMEHQCLVVDWIWFRLCVCCMFLFLFLTYVTWYV